MKVDNFFMMANCKNICCGPHHCGLSRWPSDSRSLRSAILNSPLECQHSEIFFHDLMAFALTYLQDHGAFHLFSHDNFAMKREAARFFKNYKFKIKEEWTINNFLDLANSMNPSKNVSSNYNILFGLLHI